MYERIRTMENNFMEEKLRKEIETQKIYRTEILEMTQSIST